jgi:CheY-like chemotaxis protein
MINRRIIVVEDDTDEIELLQHTFDRLNFHQVEFYPDAYSVLTHLKNTDKNMLPGLIVSDYHMPKINGFSLATFLKKHDDYGAIKIIVMSEQMPQNEEHRLLKAGVSMVLKKPTSVQDYRDFVAELISLV